MTSVPGFDSERQREAARAVALAAEVLAICQKAGFQTAVMLLEDVLMVLEEGD